MLHHRDLLTQLSQLTHGVDGDLGEIAERIADVTDTLQQAVSGSVGLQITVVRSGYPVTLDATLTELTEDATTSLGVPLPLLSPAFEPGGRVVFYSTVPGALVDLAADLTYVLPRTGRPTGGVELDVDLPLVPGGPEMTDLDGLATLHRAAGLLIGQGHHPDTAHQALHEQAAAQRLTTLTYARQILRR